METKTTKVNRDRADMAFRGLHMGPDELTVIGTGYLAR